MAKQIFLTKKNLKQLPALYSTEHDKDPMVWVKFFLGSFTWYMTEYDPEKDLFFGWTDNNGEGELGYISGKELKGLRLWHMLPVERDLWFEPTRLSECKEKHL